MKTYLNGPMTCQFEINKNSLFELEDIYWETIYFLETFISLKIVPSFEIGDFN